MRRYTPETRVVVHPFVQQAEGEEVVIGRPEAQIFLVLPPDAVEILEYLAVGKTVGETQSIYEQKYGEIPDLEDFLSHLENKGFVEPQSVHECGLPKIKNLKIVHNSKIRYHFANFPQRLAQRLFSRSVLIAAGILIGLALLAIASDPSLIPGWQAYFFKENATLMILVLFGLDWVTLFIHEMAHLIAARSLGVSCQLGISNRLWVLVAETDMTGIWSVPRQQRYLPFLAGPLLDAVSASILILIFFLIERQSLKVNPQIYQLTQALLLNYLLGLLWQCYFFVRTDFYYVIANAFRCKNLLKDTEVYLRNQIARFSHRIRPINQSHIPKSERRVIRWYAILWVSGRAAALGSLLFITLPVLWHYCLRLLAVLSAGYPANPQAFLDALLLLLLAVVPQSIGFCFWIRSIRTNQYSH